MVLMEEESAIVIMQRLTEKELHREADACSIRILISVCSGLKFLFVQTPAPF